MGSGEGVEGAGACRVADRTGAAEVVAGVGVRMVVVREDGVRRAAGEEGEDPQGWIRTVLVQAMVLLMDTTTSTIDQYMIDIMDLLHLMGMICSSSGVHPRTRWTGIVRMVDNTTRTGPRIIPLHKGGCPSRFLHREYMAYLQSRLPRRYRLAGMVVGRERSEGRDGPWTERVIDGAVARGGIGWRVKRTDL